MLNKSMLTAEIPFSRQLVPILLIVCLFAGAIGGYFYSANTVASNEKIIVVCESEEGMIMQSLEEYTPYRQVTEHSSKERVTFAFLPDIHWGGGGDHAKNLEKAIETTNAHKVDFVILGGDNISDGKDFIELDKELQQLNTPYYWTMGNHDTPDEKIKAWLLCNGHVEINTPFMFDAAGATFVILDSSFGPNKSNLSDYQLSHLEHTPQNNPYVMFMHHPTGGSVTDNNDLYYLGNKKDFLTLIDNLSVAAVFSGHDHRGAYIETNHGTTYVNAPSIVSADFQYELDRPVTLAIGTVENGLLSVKFVTSE